MIGRRGIIHSEGNLGCSDVGKCPKSKSNFVVCEGYFSLLLEDMGHVKT